MSSSALLEHSQSVTDNIDLSWFDINHSVTGGGSHDHVSLFAQSEIEAEYTPAGITFDDLADSNAQNIARKIGFIILLAQVITVVFKGLGGHGGNLAMAYGAGGGIMTRLACTILAVFMLTDIRVIPPIIDLLQEGIVTMGNWVFNEVGEDAGAGYDYTY